MPAKAFSEKNFRTRTDQTLLTWYAWGFTHFFGFLSIEDNHIVLPGVNVSNLEYRAILNSLSTKYYTGVSLESKALSIAELLKHRLSIKDEVVVIYLRF